jgi:HSP20 family protein
VETLAKEKSPEKKENASQEKRATGKEKKEMIALSPRREPRALAPRRSSDLMRDFDRVFDRFRRDFEDILWPSERLFTRAFSMLPSPAIRAPHVDLEDRGKDFLLKAEMPGFRKEDINIQVTEDSVEIEGSVGWKYDDKTKNYICRERECESFYRTVGLPEAIRVDVVEANLKDGVLELVMPKKTPKQKKKVPVK